MQSIDNIQRAHDVLHAYVSREIDLDQSQRDVCVALSALHVLCWVLECDAGEIFQRTLDGVMSEAMNAGYELKSAAVPLVGRPGRG